MHGNHILIVEDEQRLSEILQKQLRESGFTADIANDGYVGRMMAEETDYDLIILDINLPLLNGYELCKEIRKTKSGIPIIMLTAFSTPDNKLAGFEAGADDYVLKPFDFRELLARIKVFLKRSDIHSFHSNLQIADLVLDIETKSAIRAGKKIELTSREFALMETFLKNKGKLLSREFIFEKVWGIDFETGTNIIDVYINYLRKKVDADFEPKLIHNKFGFGFYCSENEL
jgi:two-component system, OmpR family, copper resistance phosphate regulon response regulator CusR